MTITDIRAQLDDVNATILHLRGMDVSGKKALATHIRTWHGTRRNETPYKMLLGWRIDELRNTHEALHQVAHA